MSTKKKLMEVVKKIADINNQEKCAHSQIAAYEIGQDMPNLTKELARLYGEMERKRNTPITKELLEKAGFEYDKYSGFFILKKSPRLNGSIMLKKYKDDELDDCDSPYNGNWVLDENYVIGDSVADLEDALDLCGIDKEIEL